MRTKKINPALSSGVLDPAGRIYSTPLHSHSKLWGIRGRCRINRQLAVLIILDGWGISPYKKGNAVRLAKTPVMNSLYRKYPNTLLSASGKSVGLPSYQVGNSEAGHMNIGAGRIVEQDSVIISKSINDGTFFRNPAFLEAIDFAKKRNSKIHLMGLLADEQSAHADPDHLLALLTLLRPSNLKKIFLHLFTDGRDSPQYIAMKLIQKLRQVLHKNEKIATISGRYYAMDRVKDWSRIEKAYNAIALGQGLKARDAESAILSSYNKGENDEFIQPTVICKNNNPIGKIDNGDVIIFFNLRSDRVRELTKCFSQSEKFFVGFKRKKLLKDIFFVGLTDFGPDLPGVISAYPSKIIKNTLPFVLKGYRQLYIAESEKFAHITYFFNGGYADPVANEERIMIKSPQVVSYDQKPEMNAEHLTNELIKHIQNNIFDFICVNYANPDMVGHTGNLQAGIKAVEFIDKCLGRLINAILKKNGIAFVIADHGNIEEMIDLKTGEINTSHSTFPVPFIIVKKGIKKKKMKKGVLANIAPTILHFLNKNKPKEMNKETICF